MANRDRGQIFSRFPWASLGRRETPDEFFGKCVEQTNRVSLLAGKPRFSLVVTVPPEFIAEHLQETIDAVIAQSYPHWELILVTSEALSIPVPSGAITIHESFATEAHAKRRGAERATGDWVGFIRGGDVLSPAALFQIAWELERDPHADLFFTDEVTVDNSSRELRDFLSKSEYSPFTLWHFDAIGAFWTVRRELFLEAGGIDPNASGIEDHECLLRIAERTPNLRHLPFYFYHRREGSAPAGDSAKLATAVRACLQRVGFPATVDEVAAGGKARVRVVPQTPAERPLISAILCFRDRAEWTIRAAQSLASIRRDLPLEIVLVDNDSTESERSRVESWLPTLPCPAKLVSYHGAFNFGHMHNTVIREHVRGDLLLLLNNDVFLDERSDLAEWAAWAAQPWVGTVGILLRYAHGQVQHSGIRARFGGEARLVRLGHSSAEQSFVYESREVFANTFAACLLKRSVFEAIGGLRQVDMANGFGDVAFNFDCLRRGWHNLYLGHLQGMHLESASRGAGASYEYWEERELEREYPEILERMLRSDFGYDTVPSHDHSIARAIGQALRIKFRQSTPWLDPLKPAVKKLLWNLQQRRHNRSEI